MRKKTKKIPATEEGSKEGQLFTERNVLGMSQVYPYSSEDCKNIKIKTYFRPK